MTSPTSPMQYQDKFNALAKAAEITPEEETVAKFFWYAGLRHAFQRGTSEAALFKPKPTKDEIAQAMRKDFEWKFPSKPAYPTADFAGKNDMLRYKGYDSEISPYEAKLLSLVLAGMLSEVQGQIRQFEKEVNALWKYCDKDDENTEETFKLMNRGRARIRKAKKQSNTLNLVQAKLKRIAKGL